MVLADVAAPLPVPTVLPGDVPLPAGMVLFVPTGPALGETPRPTDGADFTVPPLPLPALSTCVTVLV